MADQQQHGLDAFTLHQPQVARCWHRSPVGPQEWHGTQDGSQGFRPGETDTKSETLTAAWQGEGIVTAQSAVNTLTHQKE